MRLRAASLCHTNKPAASSTRKMQLRYLQHVFLCTTSAGSLECSSFVLRKPAAPSKSMAVWGIIRCLSSRCGSWAAVSAAPAFWRSRRGWAVGHGWSAASGARAVAQLLAKRDAQHVRKRW